MRNVTVGRIVHYMSFGTPHGEYKAELRAAVITQIHEIQFGENIPSVGLCIFNPTGLFFQTKVSFSEEAKPGTWSWPVIEDERKHRE